jgi:hypothetical protein
LAGVKGQTVSGWLDLLQQNALAVRLAPYHTNLSKRLVRTPKIYFLAIEAKLAVQNVAAQIVPPALSKLLPSLSEIWIVMAGGAETRLSASSIAVPIRGLADMLERAVNGE